MAGEKSFEEAIERLERIVELLEKGELPLEESLKLFEEGVSLYKFCNEKLDDVEQKIETLVEERGEIRIIPEEEEEQ